MEGYDVSGGGNISGVVEPKQTVSKFVKENRVMISACFDEYYFIIPESVIKPVAIHAGVYNIGDNIPVKGETYFYPGDFNIIDLHFKLVAKVRDSKLSDLISINEYTYDQIPAINMMGFGIKLSSQEDLDEFKQDFTKFSINDREKLAAFANKWFDILKFRTIRYK
ncbi:MAG: hypothetical protein N3B21_16190 [Clostridia bacterium]|nr:hypothetical protein [Clostridia bacterium]